MMLFALPLALALLVFCEFGGGIVAREVNLVWLRRKVRGKLVLTYDDGPGVRLESRLTALLKEKNATATFFLNAKRSLEYPQRMTLLKDAGHEVACHTFEHRNVWQTAPWSFLKDMGKAYRVLDNWLTTRSVYRPPSGKISASVWLWLAAKSVRLAFWTQDSGDTFIQLPELSRIVANVSLADGGVVLMHSFDRTGADSVHREQYVVELTDRLLELARQRQWQVCSFSDLLAGG